MKIDCREFPGVGYLSHVCDLCGDPIVALTYRGKGNSEYCSRTCREASEEKETTMRTKKAAKAVESVEAVDRVYGLTPQEAEEAVFTEENTAAPKKANIRRRSVAAEPAPAPAKKGKGKTAEPAPAPAKNGKGKTAEPAPAPAKKGKGKTAEPAPAKRGTKGSVENPYRPTSAFGVIFDLLKDGKPHTSDEITKVAKTVGNEQGVARARKMAWVTKDDDRFSIAEADGTFQMTF